MENKDAFYTYLGFEEMETSDGFKNFIPNTDLIFKTASVSSEEIGKEIAEISSNIINQLDKIKKATDDSSYAIDEVGIKLVLTEEGKVSFLSAAGVSGGISETIELKIKKK